VKGVNPQQTEKIVRQALKELDVTHIDAIILFLGAITFMMKVIADNNLRGSLENAHAVFPETIQDDVKECLDLYMTGSLAIIHKVNEIGRKEMKNG
jgi:hypothetical protein